MKQIKNLKGSAALWIIGIVGVLVLSGVSYYVWNKNKPLSYNQETESPKSTTDKFTDWKTYKNTKYGFEFKYPQNTVLKLLNSQQLATGNESGVSLTTDENQNPLFVIFIESESVKTSLDSIIKEKTSPSYVDAPITKIGETTIAGERGVKVRHSGDGGTSDVIYFIHKNKLFFISSGDDEPITDALGVYAPKEYKNFLKPSDYFEKILGTLKFN